MLIEEVYQLDCMQPCCYLKCLSSSLGLLLSIMGLPGHLLHAPLQLIQSLLLRLYFQPEAHSHVSTIVIAIQMHAEPNLKVNLYASILDLPQP